MPESSPPADGQRQHSTVGNLAQRWASGTRLAAAVGLAYLLAGQLSIGLLMPPEGIAVFWPAAGLSSGVLIALGPGERLPVAAGAMVATIVVNLFSNQDIWATCAFALGNTAEPLIIAGLIEHYFGAGFSLDRLRHVFGLLAAAVVGPSVAGIGWAVVYRLFHITTVPILTTWLHWFTSDITGVATVAPLVIWLVGGLPQLPRRSEIIEGTMALLALAVTTVIAIFLPQRFWETVSPLVWLFPVLFWIAYRCRPVFAAVANFIVSNTIVCTTVFGIGHFGSSSFPIADRILGSQVSILFVAIWALILSALFAERRDSETRLARSNMLLERERDNKLMNMQAITAAIAHEVKQPLAAIVANGGAALRYLRKAPPDLDEVGAALNRIISDGHRTSEVFDSIRALFRKGDQGRQQLDVNEIILEVLRSVRGELEAHGVETRSELTSTLPLVSGHRAQLQEVIFNLVRNAIEAMDATTHRGRTLRVRTGLNGHDAITVAVQDSGPGIDPKRIESIFDAFFTTKPHGMGLGLAICRMIIQHHGGQLSVSSDGKNGALFQFDLPIKSPDEAAARGEHEQKPGTRL